MSIYFYGCISLDGFLADKNHSLKWLDETGLIGETSYDDFYQKIDITIMGKKTYDAIKTIDDFTSLYKSTINYVLTNHPNEIDKNFIPIKGNIVEFLKTLPRDKNIWIVGGNTLVTPLINENLFDYLIIQTAPVLLGSGIPLFKDIIDVRRYHLASTNRFGDFSEITLSKK